MASDMPSYRPGRACAAWPLQGTAWHIRSCRHSQLAASVTLRILETQMHEGIERGPGASRAVCRPHSLPPAQCNVVADVSANPLSAPYECVSHNARSQKQGGGGQEQRRRGQRATALG